MDSKRNGSRWTQTVLTVCHMFVAAGGFRKYWLFGAQYFLQGAFYGLLTVVIYRNWLPREWGVTKESGQLGLLASAMMWPWAIKFVLGPIADLLRRHQRMVLLGCNGGMAVVAILLAQVATGDCNAVLWFVIAASILRCLQDVTIDGLAIATLPPEDIATVNTVEWLSQTVGAWVGGAGMLALQATYRTEFRTLTVIVAAIVAVAAILGFAMSSVAKKILPAKTKAHKVDWKRFTLTFVFALLSLVGGGAFCSAFIGPWFGSLNFDTSTLATLETVSSVASIGGVLIFGLVGKRLTSKVFGAGIVLAASYVAVGLLAPAWHYHGLMVVVIGVVTVGEAMWNVALAAIFMAIASTEKTKAATLYAAFVSVANASAALGPVAGNWAGSRFGYPTLMILAGVMVIPSLILLRRLRVPEQTKE